MAMAHEIRTALDEAELRAALNRADRIIGWMADYIGRMTTPANGISELNEHWLFMEQNGVPVTMERATDLEPLAQNPMSR